MLAVLGPVVVLAQEWLAGLPLKPRQEGSFVVLGLAIPIVLFTIARLMPAAWARLRHHPDLLVPLGLLTLAEAVLGWLAQLPMLGAILAPAQDIRIAALAFTISVNALLLIVLHVAFAAWTTWLIIQVVREGRAELIESIRMSQLRFFRALGLVLIGWGVLFAGVAAGLALAAVSLFLALPVMGIAALVWNLATAALLPVALADRRDFWQAFRAAVQLSWFEKGRWWKAVVVQMVLMGWLTFIHVSYTDMSPGRIHVQTKHQVVRECLLDRQL